jgi:predicted transcriptional regulator
LAIEDLVSLREIPGWGVAYKIHFEGKTQEEIAQELGVSQPAVSKMMKQFLQEAKKRLNEP